MDSQTHDNRSLFSFFLILCGIIGYFLYLMHYSLINTTWDFTTKVLLPMTTLPIIGYLFTSEILECKRFGRSKELCVKRFTGRILLNVGLILLFFLFVILTIWFHLWNTLDLSNLPILLFVSLGWIVTVILLLRKYKEGVRKLNDGRW